MDNVFYDPIVAEVRKNREELLADFGGDMNQTYAVPYHCLYVVISIRLEEIGFVRYESGEGKCNTISNEKIERNLKNTKPDASCLSENTELHSVCERVLHSFGKNPLHVR